MTLTTPRRPRHMRTASIPFGLAAALLAAGVAIAGGGPATVIEAGAITDYSAPDPGGPTQGSITFGFTGSPEAIAADAELVPPADTNLGSINGGTPTCLEVTRESGLITRLAFVAECTVTGAVVLVEDAFGPDADGYMIGDRLLAPAAFLATSSEFQALIGVPADAGTTLSVAFVVDTGTGYPVTFVGTTSVAGPVTLLDGGDIGVDGAVLPNEVIDESSRAALTEAASLGVDASVAITGNGNMQVKGDMPDLVIVLAVSYTAPTPPPTPSPVPTVSPSPGSGELPDAAVGPAAGGSAPASVDPTWLGLGVVALAAALAAGLAYRRVVGAAGTRGPS